MVDKNLFLYDLAVVAIMKNEAPYVKEWLDYHILAGVDHFYIYDNDSPDNLKQILQPYIDDGTVTYTFYPGKCRQMEAYNDAVHRFRFFSRYMAFNDGDEFIFPQNNKSIVEVADEILSDKPNACGLAMNFLFYGSNNLETADYSKGVLERFTRHADKAHTSVKTLANPRRIKVVDNPHFVYCFEGYHIINENGGVVPLYSNNPPTTEKIFVSHYSCKSREEYEKKVKRGYPDRLQYKFESFKHENNEIFDDSILKYRENRLKWRGGAAVN